MPFASFFCDQPPADARFDDEGTKKAIAGRNRAEFNYEKG
jgi:hypothetical protein